MHKEFTLFKVTVGPWDKLHHHEDSVQITADYPATLNIPPSPQKELKILEGGGVRGPGISGEGVCLNTFFSRPVSIFIQLYVKFVRLHFASRVKNEKKRRRQGKRICLTPILNRSKIIIITIGPRKCNLKEILNDSE